MPTVSVDLEDLETLVVTSGALKTIEGALQARKTDPFVRPHLDFSAAHDRLASAMRNARRAEAGTLVNFDAPLTEHELAVLRALDAVDGFCSINSSEKRPEPGEQMSVYDRLAAKGCVTIGQFVQGIIWAGASAPEVQADPKGFAVKVTYRGHEKLAAAVEAKAEA